MTHAAPRALPPIRLDGTWLLAADPRHVGRRRGWHAAPAADAVPTPVPGIAQQTLPDAQHGVCWFWRRFQPPHAPRARERALLRFTAVHNVAEVWLNGQRLGAHAGLTEPFTLDATAALRADGDNLVAVRVGGMGTPLAADPDAPESDAALPPPRPWLPGGGSPSFGFFGGVELVIVPAVRVTALWLRPQADGRIDVVATIANDTDAAADARLRCACAPATGGDAVAGEEIAIAAPPGVSAHALALAVASPRRWDLDDPFLYRVDARLRGDDVAHAFAARCGFREFDVVDGSFRLNGRRLWLRSTHTGNHTPISIHAPMAGVDTHRRDLLMAKASGYNCVRFIARPALAHQLDLCDEIGLLVYEEPHSSWLRREMPDYPAFHDRELRALIERDRNHPSLVIYGLLNECKSRAQIDHARGCLPLLRSLDPTRVVVFMSGRWDGDHTFGTVCRPGETTWSRQWGDEAPDAAPQTFGETMGYVAGAGDAHVYPGWPMSPQAVAQLRGLGHTGKPVLLSEFGVGSQINAIEELKGYDAHDVRHDLADRVALRGMAERFASAWTRWGFDVVYPFPEDFLRASSEHMARQRRIGFDYVRANPKLVGYNLTGMLDHALTGEGLWTFWRRWKPGAMEVLQDGWAPLRWCLIAPRHVHAGRAFDIEVTLADDAALPPGEHPARIRLFAAGRGAAWERRLTIAVPPGPRDARPIATTVLRERIEGLPAGDYVLAADLERGGIAAADRLSIRIAEPAPALRAAVELLGIPDAVAAWLTARGARCAPFSPDGEARVVLVGEPAEATAATWAAVRARAQRGATVVFLSHAPFAAKDVECRPLGDAVSVRWITDWLYRHDLCAKDHPLFAGLPTGLIDCDDYGMTIGHWYYGFAEDPAEVVAAAFGLGITYEAGDASWPVVSVLRRGRGRIVVHGFRILPEIDVHPAAERLLLNLVAFADGAGREPSPATAPSRRRVGQLG